jgi:glyoxylase-like metal-dependent hydrolase (beta-lactamase superfamily II)
MLAALALEPLNVGTRNMKILKRLAIVVLTLLIFVALAGVYLLGSEDVPEWTTYQIDLPKLRILAESIPGEFPTEIRFENIATAGLPRALSMAGEGFEFVEMPRPVFQVLFSDGSYMLIDSAYDRESHDARFSGRPYFDAAWEDLLVAMDGASQIVLTHEHLDHFGGIARHPRALALADRLRLTEEQLATPRQPNAELPPGLLERLEPLRYDGAMAIAPGVVLQKAAGHSPGSQVVFVRLASGRELLFVGDVVWNRDAITELKYRPRLTTDLFLGEDRQAVLQQLRALRNLYDTGEVAIVISHDARTFASADLIEGFAVVD